MSALVAVPSRGRLRDGVVALLSQAGYRPGVRGDVEFIEMRPRDAGAWLVAGRIDGAFLSTDIVLEERLHDMAALSLGTARSDLVVASREDDGRRSANDLAGAVVATHLPNATRDWFTTQQIDVTIVAMGGALEGVCAAGLADAIVDLRETGASLASNGLRALAEIGPCESLLVYGDRPELGDVALRLRAAVDASGRRYVMLHLPPERVDALGALFPGLVAPTVLPLAGRDDLVAVHFVAEAATLWARLAEIRAIGRSGIVALPPDAVLP